jgi:hypothetical protein
MQIIYQDEYGNGLFWGQTAQPIAPMVGDAVVIEEEEYRVKSKTFFPEKDEVIVEVTQSLVRSKETTDDSSGRLAEMSRAILAVNKRQDASEKKGRMLNEQVVTIRKHINQRIQQERKES